MNQISLKKQYPENTKGRDFVVGDIHGAYQSLLSQLEKVKFDPSKDRLFCTGDLCNRGPRSLETLRLLRNDYFYCAMGNHDFFILNFLSSSEKEREEKKEYLSENGAGWLYRLNKEQLDEVQDLAQIMVKKCPMICEVSNHEQEVLFRVAHASLPDFYLSIKGDYEVIDEDISLLCWERSKADYANRAAKTQAESIDVDGKNWNIFDSSENSRPITFLGHTIFDQPTYKDGFAYIDTGAFESETENSLSDIDQENKMTLIDVRSITDALHEHFHAKSQQFRF